MNQLVGFGLYIFGATVAALMIAGCLLSSAPLMGAAVICGVQFFALLTLGIIHDLERAKK